MSLLGSITALLWIMRWWSQLQFMLQWTRSPWLQRGSGCAGSARGGEGIYRLGDGPNGDVSLDACWRSLELQAPGSARDGEAVRTRMQDSADDASSTMFPTTLFYMPLCH